MPSTQQIHSHTCCTQYTNQQIMPQLCFISYKHHHIMINFLLHPSPPPPPPPPFFRLVPSKFWAFFLPVFLV